MDIELLSALHTQIVLKARVSSAAVDVCMAYARICVLLLLLLLLLSIYNRPRWLPRRYMHSAQLSQPVEYSHGSLVVHTIWSSEGVHTYVHTHSRNRSKQT